MIDMSGWGSVVALVEDIDRALTRAARSSYGELLDTLANERRMSKGRLPPCGACGLPFDRCPRCD